MKTDIHVAVAVIENEQREVLVSRRADNVHQGGLWEFPGGKLEAGETVEQALKREIAEELDLKIHNTVLLKRVRHRYPDKSVMLDFYRVTEFSGEPRGMEGQPVKWQAIDELQVDQFPAANRGIVRCLQLPQAFMITGNYADESDFHQRLQQSLEQGIRLVQLRVKQVSDQAYLSLLRIAQPLCEQYGAHLLLNCELSLFLENPADGLHLSSQQLHSLQQRPFSNRLLLSASCHTQQDIEQAMKLQADLILLSPVKETASHPGVPGIGWHKFTEMAQLSDVPVYALGGMKASDLEDALCNGAQGVAAISSFWREIE